MYPKAQEKKSKVLPNGKCRIFLVLRKTKNDSFKSNQKEKWIKTDKFIEPAYFDNKLGNVTTSAPDYIRLKHFINGETKKLDNIIVDLENSSKPVTYQTVEKAYVRQSLKSFANYALEELKRDELDLSASTARNYKICLNRLMAYDPELTIEEITDNFLEEYRYYLANAVKLKRNSYYKDFAVIKKYFLKAKDQGFVNHNPFKAFKFSQEETDIEFLLIEEVNKLQGLYDRSELTEPLQKTLGFFLFSCYTGIAHDDLVHKDRLRFTDTAILFTRKKVKRKGKRILIPINQKIRKMIPHVNQYNLKQKHHRVNTDLLEIMALAGINKDITYHCARHTFAICSLMMGIGLKVIQDVLGHSSVKTTEIYLKVVDQYKTAQMLKWDEA